MCVSIGMMLLVHTWLWELNPVKRICVLSDAFIVTLCSLRPLKALLRQMLKAIWHRGERNVDLKQLMVTAEVPGLEWRNKALNVSTAVQNHHWVQVKEKDLWSAHSIPSQRVFQTQGNADPEAQAMV